MAKMKTRKQATVTVTVMTAKILQVKRFAQRRFLFFFLLLYFYSFFPFIKSKKSFDDFTHTLMLI